MNANVVLGGRIYRALLVLAWAWVALFHTGVYCATPDKVRLQLKWYHQFQFAGYYAAQSMGYYKDEGLNVEIIEGGPEKQPEKIVLQNKAEFGVHDGGDLILRRLQGAPVAAVATIFQHSSYVIISKQSKGVRHPADLVGRKVMITQEQGSAQILAMFRREGIKVNSTFDAKPVLFAPHSLNVEDLIEERADAMTAYLTDIPRFKRQFGFVPAILNPLDYGIDFYGDTLFTSNKFLQEEPAVVERFRRASLKGWQFAMANPETIVDLILALSSTRQKKTDRQSLLDEAHAMDNIVLPKLVEMGNMNAGRWEQMAKTYQELGMVQSISNLEGFPYEIDAKRRDIQRQLQIFGVLALGAALLAGVSLVWVRLLRSRVLLRTRELTQEIAQRKQVEQELRDSKALTEAIVENIPLMIFVKDAAELRFVAFNRAGEELVGYERKDLLGKNDLDFFSPDQAAHFMAKDREVLEGGMNVLDIPEEPIQTVKKGLRLLHTRKVCIQGGDGHTQYLLGISEDITERKQNELSLQQSLEEKKALLNEVHHRVKNNLQVIISLLRLEARRSTQADTKVVLAEMQGRIRSMALLHESLYRSGVFASIELGSYLRSLANQAFRGQANSSGTVRLLMDYAPLQVSMDLATPCGLLVNELIANCLKHGFPQDRSGEVKVELHPVNPDRAQDGFWRLCVSDNGVGLPPDFEAKRKTSLGLQLVDDLSRQIKAALVIQSQPDAGAEFTVTFRVPSSV